MTGESQEIIDLIARFLRRPDVVAAYLFGSRARGTESKRSDIDLVIVADTVESFARRGSAFDDLHAALTVPLDLFVYTPAEWEVMKRRPFFRDAPLKEIPLNV